ncbi:MAG TPA: hypothetical protein VJ623_02075 [Holophagaceae bacterium]|nr:hypothetical protein [Holophagaceae bacterium]
MKLRTLLTVLTVVSILQLGLLWIQGAQLYRQQESLQSLRLDIQELADVIDSGNGQGGGEEGNWTPSRDHARGGHHRFRRIALQDEETAKELKDSRESQEAAKKAVKDAREVQQKLSISEAAKRAEEQEKIKAAEYEWTRWVWIGLGVVVLSLLLRAWLRRR